MLNLQKNPEFPKLAQHYSYHDWLQNCQQKSKYPASHISAKRYPKSFNNHCYFCPQLIKKSYSSKKNTPSHIHHSNVESKKKLIS